MMGSSCMNGERGKGKGELEVGGKGGRKTVSDVESKVVVSNSNKVSNSNIPQKNIRNQDKWREKGRNKVGTG
jgi:hypothetical protein